MSRCLSRAVTTLTALAVHVAAADAQTLRVLADSNTPVPYALIAVNGANERVANAKGEVTLKLPVGKPAELGVRRLGYRPFVGPPSTDSLGLFVRIQPIAIQLDAVVSMARESTPLSRTGFYDRLERVQRGAILGEFMTPEQLDDRPGSNTSDLLHGQRYVRVGRASINGRSVPVMLGRGGCGMTVLVDGQRVAGMVEEAVGGAATSINSQGTRQATRSGGMDIDQAVAGTSVSAIEIYPSTANAPAELQSLGGRGSCGIIAIWTGPRR